MTKSASVALGNLLEIAKIDETLGGLTDKMQSLQETNPQIDIIAETLGLTKLEPQYLPQIIIFARKTLRERNIQQNFFTDIADSTLPQDGKKQETQLKRILDYYYRHGIDALSLALSNDSLNATGITLYNYLNESNINLETYTQIRYDFLQAITSEENIAKLHLLYDQVYPKITAKEEILEDGAQQIDYYNNLDQLKVDDIVGALSHIQKREYLTNIAKFTSGQDVFGKDHFKDLKANRGIICYSSSLRKLSPSALFKEFAADRNGSALAALKSAAAQALKHLYEIEIRHFENGIVKTEKSFVIRGGEGNINNIAKAYFEGFSSQLDKSKEIGASLQILDKVLPLVKAVLIHRDYDQASETLNSFIAKVVDKISPAASKQLDPAILSSIDKARKDITIINKEVGKEESPLDNILRALPNARPNSSPSLKLPGQAAAAASTAKVHTK